MKTYFKQALAFTALVCLLLMLIITPVARAAPPANGQPLYPKSAEGKFPEEGSWAQMSIQYTASNVRIVNTVVDPRPSNEEVFANNLQTVTGTFDPNAKIVHLVATVYLEEGAPDAKGKITLCDHDMWEQPYWCPTVEKAFNVKNGSSTKIELDMKMRETISDVSFLINVTYKTNLGLDATYNIMHPNDPMAQELFPLSLIVKGKFAADPNAVIPGQIPPPAPETTGDRVSKASSWSWNSLLVVLGVAEGGHLLYSLWGSSWLIAGVTVTGPAVIGTTVVTVGLVAAWKFLL